MDVGNARIALVSDDDGIVIKPDAGMLLQIVFYGKNIRHIARVGAVVYGLAGALIHHHQHIELRSSVPIFVMTEFSLDKLLRIGGNGG